jgi:acyl-CoA-binding protein
LNIDGRLKWDAWAAEDSKSVEEARQAYVDLAKELIGTEIVESVLTTG